MSNTKPESLRQVKVASQIQRDLGEYFTLQSGTFARGCLLSVTKVRMTPDLAVAKVYLSVFPFDRSEDVLKRVRANASTIRGVLGRKVRNQLRIVPELLYYNDDSQDYVENIDRLLALDPPRPEASDSSEVE